MKLALCPSKNWKWKRLMYRFESFFKPQKNQKSTKVFEVVSNKNKFIVQKLID